MNSKPERILVIMPGLNVCGGMESFIMNYFRNIDKSRYIFDFITHDISENSYVEEIKKLGGKVYKLPPFSIKKIKEIKTEYEKILQNNHYKIVHCNMANAAFLYLKIAKQYQVPYRILHSHQNKAADTLSHEIRNIPLIQYGKRYANIRFACSKSAGDYLFKNKNYYVVENAIDYEKCQYNENKRIEMRKKLGLNNHFVIGHTGRLCPQKNQKFLLEVFQKVHLQDPTAKLVLVGEGADYKELVQSTINMDIKDNVLFLGSRDDVSDILQAFDVFVFPSLYEGLGISVLEAQANHLPCICSTFVPMDANISSEIDYYSLDSDLSQWVNGILKYKGKERKEFKLDDRYNIKKKADDYVLLLDKIMKKR